MISDLKDVKEKIVVGKYVFILGDDEETDKDLRKLAALIREEGTHYQWKKWGINLVSIIGLCFMNYEMPKTSRASPIGVGMCSANYWGT